MEPTGTYKVQVDLLTLSKESDHKLAGILP